MACMKAGPWDYSDLGMLYRLMRVIFDGPMAVDFDLADCCQYTSDIMAYLNIDQRGLSDLQADMLYRFACEHDIALPLRR